MLHLHRFENEQRLPFLHARAGLDHHLDHLPGHGRGERARRRGVLRRLQLRLEREPPVAAVAEHVPLAAVAYRVRLEAASIQADERPVPLDAVIPRADQQPLATIGKAHAHRMVRLAIHENEIVVRFLVQSPAIDALPWRVSIARFAGVLAGGLLLRLELGERGDGQHFVRHGSARREQLGAVPFDQPGIELGGRKGAARRHPSQESDVGRHAGDLGFGERAAQPCQRGVAVRAAHDQLRDHRVVPRRDFASGLDAGVDAHVVRFGGKREVQQLSGRREKIALRVLGVNARLDGVPREAQFILQKRKPLSCRDPQLPLDQVEPGNHLGDRVLDLQARIHLHEVEAPILLGDEFHRAGAAVADGARRGDGGLPHLAAPLRRHAGRRRLFQHFLVPSLHRAVALEQMHCVAVRIAEHLHFDMPRPLQVALDEHAVISERGLGFTSRRLEHRSK